MRTRIILGMALFILTMGVVGCGVGDNGASSAGLRKAQSKVSLATLDQTVGGIQFTLNMPAGVTVPTDASGVSSAAVELVGATGNASLQKTYTTDPATGKGKLMILVIEPGGFTTVPEQSIMIHLDITGAVPQTADFSIEGLIISDLNGRTVTGLQPVFSVDII